MPESKPAGMGARPGRAVELRAAASLVRRCSAAAYGLVRGEHWTRERLDAHRSARLRRLVAHAAANVPYYRQLFERHGLRPGDIRGIEDLERIPVTTRADLQRIPPADLVARGLDPARLAGSTTSGSTGRPLTLRRSWLDVSILQAFRLRGCRRMGWRLRDHEVFLSRSIGRKQAGGNKTVGNLFRRVGLLRHSAVDLFLEPAAAAASLAAANPDVIHGFPSALEPIADHLTRQPLAALRPRLILSMGEVLTARARRVIGEGFRARVRDEYGCQELNQIAWECPRSGAYHTADDAVITEVRNGAAAALPGESGDVVTTSLHQFSTPLIRYAPGDRAVRGPGGCACGTPFESLAAITGRSLDFFRLPGGRVLHPYALVNCFIGDADTWIGRYQLEQLREDRVEMHIVPARPPTPEELAGLEHALATVLGSRVELAVELVSEIAPDPSGKLRPSRSLVPRP